jgi:hypothetical protein
MVAALLVPLPAIGATGSGLTETMGYLVGEFSVLLSASVAPKPLSTVQRERVNTALTEIADQGYLLAAHSGRDELSFMAYSLGEMAGALGLHHRNGNNEDFEQTLDQMLGTCSACHQRTSRGRGSAFASSVLDHQLMQSLAPLRRARVMIATRQFEAAANVLDGLLGASSELETLDKAMTLRLELGIRVLPDLHALRTRLAKLEARAEVPSTIQATAQNWNASLRFIQDLRARNNAPLAHAEKMHDVAQNGHSAEAIPRLLEISRASHLAIEEPNLDPESRARAYELAAIAEGALEPESPLPMQELYLEQAIRAAPRSATARSAFTQIEQLLAQQFKGNPPAYVTPHLERLRSLAY